MPKDVTFDGMTGLEGKVIFNYNDGSDYYVAAIRFQITAKGLNARRDLTTTIPFGSPSATKFTIQQIYTAVSNKMGQDVANEIKDLYLEGINEDISV